MKKFRIEIETVKVLKRTYEVEAQNQATAEHVAMLRFNNENGDGLVGNTTTNAGPEIASVKLLP